MNIDFLNMLVIIGCSTIVRYYGDVDWKNFRLFVLLMAVLWSFAGVNHLELTYSPLVLTIVYIIIVIGYNGVVFVKNKLTHVEG